MMKTYIGYLIFMCSLLLCSCQQTTSNPRFYDEGVSQELATLRKQEIKELKYKLYFSIPEQNLVSEAELHGFFGVHPCLGIHEL